MPVDTSPATRRITAESAARLVAVYAARWGLTGRPQPAADWTFTVAVVAGLTHGGRPAWAVVDPQVNPVTSPDVLPGGKAHVQIRDIDATPIPGFDGDQMLEIRVTVAHEMGHPVVAEALAMHGSLTVPAEEHIVETAAQAIVRSEGTADARVMARAVRGAVPSALRARVAASAGRRARGGQMDPDLVKQALDALEAGDGAKCAELLKGLIAVAASGGAAAPESIPEPAAKVAAEPMPSADSGAVMQTEDARRANGAEMDQDKARARKAADELEAMVKAARPAAKEGLVVTLRARLGSAFTPAAEAEINAAPDFATAQTLAAFAEKLLGGAGSNTERARSNVAHGQRPPPTTSAMPTVDALRVEGFTDSWLTGYASALRSGPDVAAAFLEQGRTSARARVATSNGGAK